MITQEVLLEATQDLIAMEATAHNPDGLWSAYRYMHRFIGDVAVQYGAEITIEEFQSGGKPSLLAYHGTDRPEEFPVLMNGHLDVVAGAPDQFKPKVRDGKLYARGPYDMQAAAVAMAAVFCEYPGAALQLTTDEETGLGHGTGYQLEQGVRSKFTICGESGRPLSKREIANEAKGVLVADINLIGKAGHGAYPLQSENAIDLGVDFVMAIRQHFPKPADKAEENRVTTVSRTGFTTDSTALTQTPGLATVRLDWRYMLGDPNFEDEAAFATLIEQIYPAASVNKVHVFWEPMYTPPDHPTLQLLKAAAEQVEGGEFDLVRRNGTSDGRYFGPVGGHACEFGVAGEDQHGPNEHITLEAFKNYYHTLRAFFQKVATTEAAR